MSSTSYPCNFLVLIMLVFTSALVLFGLLHIRISRARLYLCKRFVITFENIEKFNFDEYLMVHQLATNYNMNDGHSVFKDCVKANK